MKITAQLPGVNRPLSVELRLIDFCSCDFDSQEEHDTSSIRQLLAKRSDFRSAEELVRYNPFGGDSYTINPMTAGPHFIVAFPVARVYLLREVMSTVAEIEKALQTIPLDDARKVADWLQHYLDEKWDTQIDGDIDAGRLDKLADKAIEDYRAGRVKPLDEVIDQP